jgi:hypothetical protein
VAVDSRKIAAVPLTFGLLLAVLALTAILVVTWCTSLYGIGISPDSAHYIGAARSLAAGQGLRFNGEPFSHWPPLYPLLLGVLSLTRIDALQAARLLAALLFALNTVLVSGLTYLESRRCTYAGSCAGVAFLASPEMLHIHTMAWSEPAFFCLSLLVLLLFRRWTMLGPPANKFAADNARRRPVPTNPFAADTMIFDGASRWFGEFTSSIDNRLLAVTGLFTALALLTRFVGITLLLPFLVCILACRTVPFRQRIREIFLLCGTATFPMACWLLWNSGARHAASDRPFVFHPPHATTFVLLALSTLGCLALLILLLRRQMRGNAGDFGILSVWAAAFLMTYCGFLLFALCFLDALTPLDARILSPLFVFGMPLIVSLVWRVRTPFNSGNSLAIHDTLDSETDAAPVGTSKSAVRQAHLWQGIVSAVVVAACSRGGAAFTLARQRHDLGYGYTSRAWRTSPTLAWIDALPRNVSIYSNSPELIAFHNRRAARPLPTRYSPTSLLPNADLDRDVAVLQTDLHRGAIVIYFTRNPRSYLLSATDLEQRYQLPARLRLPDGTVYGYSRAAIMSAGQAFAPAPKLWRACPRCSAGRSLRKRSCRSPTGESPAAAQSGR